MDAEPPHNATRLVPASTQCRFARLEELSKPGLLQELKSLPKPAVEAAYDHWCSKRLKAKRPLLQRLWFEQPWVRVREASKEHCGAPGSPRYCSLFFWAMYKMCHKIVPPLLHRS